MGITLKYFSKPKVLNILTNLVAIMYIIDLIVPNSQQVKVADMKYIKNVRIFLHRDYFQQDNFVFQKNKKKTLNFKINNLKIQCYLRR
jgi:hypothetical protein